MHVYLINLNKDAERLAAADAQLRRLGVAYKRVSAVYAKDLSQKELDAAVDKFRWWCSVGRSVRIGEIGCAMSHRKVYEEMEAKEIEIACVLEDDVVLNNGFVEALDEIERRFTSGDAVVVQLGNRWNLPDGNKGLRKISCEYGAYAYVITRKAAGALLRCNWPMKRPCDHWHVWQRDGLMSLWQFMPPACVHDERFTSNTAPEGSFHVKNLNFVQFCIHKFNRLIGKTIDKLM